MSTYTWIAAAAFGLEGLVRRELERLGFDAVRAETGGARFEADMVGALRANLSLRCADRVLWVLAEARAVTFTELFDLASGIAWEDILPPKARFPVTGHCAKSQLMSERDCQAIIKKAIANRLMSKRGGAWCEESGAEYAVRFSLHSDTACLTLNSSGEALNKRGYRVLNGEAALRETLAAALVELSPSRGMPVYDPCCGTGTLLIETALRRARIAPGLKRSFAMEAWAPHITPAQCTALREELRARIDLDQIGSISGSDIDEQAISYCNTHIKRAGLERRITVSQADLRTLTLPGDAPFFIANPPYGERMGDKKQAEALYAELRALLKRHPGGGMGVIASHPVFERVFGMRADKKRRLYNGRLECEYMIFTSR